MAYNTNPYSMNGLAGYSYSPNSQYALLDEQTAEFGPEGLDLTNNALASNTNGMPSAGGGNGLFGLNQNTWGNIGTAGQLATGLAGAYTNWQNLELAKKAFDFNKSMKEKEYAMAKDAYDRNVARATSIGDQMRAGAAGNV